MNLIRNRIESQILSLTGASLGQIDLDSPKGDPGLFGPESMPWKVHGDFTSMMIGGISALLLQMLHPLALAGVWDHSNFRQDMLGRLRRTSLFISGTTYGNTRDAEWLIDKVRTIHLQVVGSAPDGRPYAASDPDLLTWVHVAEVSSFLGAYLRHLDPAMPGADQDRYYEEIALVAERLGARNVPKSRRAVADYLDAMRPQMLCDERTLEVVRLLRDAPAPSALAKPFGNLMMQAGIELLPTWAMAMLGLRLPDWQRPLIRAGVQRTAPMLRWALRNGASSRARRRMGLPAR
ncbi:oxygenase MpaB family protein [Pseudomonas sp. No.21]|uniref:oxygenase MpaB family protein n=1 Tax=Pseudomonas TaxID=286 RepID=UPI000DA8DEBB|nr:MULTISPECIES: oxygenase MpaB family protein [Pseudomonas]MDW3714420.1 oxygenase MpaB family protein [Pseudomonas sp. 2023EL-01195]PZE14432.1 histidine kinase [Pseudomonas sp. 57B-090624]GJN48580.1 histidine kinase [Pseudomonas tohonis]